MIAVKKLFLSLLCLAFMYSGTVNVEGPGIQARGGGIIAEE